MWACFTRWCSSTARGISGLVCDGEWSGVMDAAAESSPVVGDQSVAISEGLLSPQRCERIRNERAMHKQHGQAPSTSPPRCEIANACAPEDRETATESIQAVAGGMFRSKDGGRLAVAMAESPAAGLALVIAFQADARPSDRRTTDFTQSAVIFSSSPATRQEPAQASRPRQHG